MLVISSRISGWRVTASITLPKMIPMPTPAPSAPRPPPIPIPRPALTPAAMWRMGMNTFELLGRSVMGDGAAEIDGGQSGEDEGLQRGDQAELEEVDGDPGREREPADPARADDHRQTPGHEQDDHVAGEYVGEEPHGERDE